MTAGPARARNNLPASLTSFVGRRAELEVVARLVEDGRLVTLTGPGGTGKTRLAVEYAREAGSFDGGVWFVEFATVDSGSAVMAAILRTFELDGERAGDPLDWVAERLAGSRALVILDNCEHVVAEAALVADDLLRRLPEVTIVATSRELLGVAGEAPFQVPTLQTPPVGASDIAELGAFESVELFIDRAARIRPGFTVDNESAPAVAEICQRLDGIPLAIELAAARVRVLSISQIREGLADRFTLLGRGPRFEAARQQTLEACIGWSYDLLDAPERSAFRRLSALAGTFELDVAAALLGETVEAGRGLDVLASLVDKSLVTVEHRAPAARYALLESIRAYGQARLDAEGDRDAVSERHRALFLDVGRALVAAAESGDDGARRKLRLYRDDLVAAFEASLAGGHPDAALDAATHLAAVGDSPAVAVGRIDQALTLREQASAAAVVRALTAKAMLGWALFDPFIAVMAGNEAAALAHDTGDIVHEGRALAIAGWFQSFIDIDAGSARVDDAIELLTRSGDDWGRAHALAGRAVIHLHGRGDPHRAIEDFEAARPLKERLGQTTNPVDADRALAIAWADPTVDVEAMIAPLVADAVARRDGQTAALLLTPLAFSQIFRGDLQAARRSVEQMHDLAPRDLVVGAVVRTETAGLEALLLFCDNRIREARDRLESLLRVLSRQDPYLPAMLRATALIQGYDNDVEAVRKTASNAGTGSGLWQPILLAGLARAERSANEPNRAEHAAHAAVELSMTTGAWHTFGAVSGLDTLAGLALDVGATEEAARVYAAVSAWRSRFAQPRLGPIERAYQIDRARLLDSMAHDRLAAVEDEGGSLDLANLAELLRRGRGQRKRPSSGWDSLTPTEQQVVELVAGGLTNPQIAERMFIARRTVTTHLGSIFAKLGVKTRAELAAATTARRHLAPPS